MKTILLLVALFVWFFLTQILGGLISTILNLPLATLRISSTFFSFLISMISGLLVLYIGIKAFELVNFNKFLIGVPIVTVISYYISLSYVENEQDGKAIKYGAITGVIIGTFLFNLI